MSQPRHSLEVERTYDVDSGTALPEWLALPGIARVGEAESRTLDARYFDTEGLDLARARVAVRRREGGPDAGWHVKVSAPEGRHEWHWPLESDASLVEEPAELAVRVPEGVVAAVARWADGPLVPLARIRNARTAYALLDERGDLVAEVVDDRVDARAVRPGTDSSWREWEVELGPAAPADVDEFFSQVDALVRAAGGRRAASDSKLARAIAG